MFPSFLITFREVLEAALITATILGVLTKGGHKQGVRTVWIATASAGALSIFLVWIASAFGLKAQELYSGAPEMLIEGGLMILSAFFITWAVFFLHNYFGKYKTTLISGFHEALHSQGQSGLFALTFTAVFREGFEIALFLSTIYFSSNPIHILSGLAIGSIAAFLICYGLFTATIRLPVYYVFKSTSALLILFAAGLLAHGIHEFTEAGVLLKTPNVYLPFLPEKATLVGGIVQSIFGVTKKMEILSLTSYIVYISAMAWWVFFRTHQTATEES